MGRGQDTLIGQLVEGKYRIDKMIGKGGMGAVYAAENTRLGKTVAIKVLTQGHDNHSPAARRFMREARVAGSIGHRNIVEVFDLGELADGTPFIVMELLEGESLADRLDVMGGLPIEQVVAIAKQILSGLEAAHNKGVIHRDLKPDNIFLKRQIGTSAPAVKIVDFGISKTTSEDTMAITMTGAVVGTPYYLSPEQARGDRDIDLRIDIWAMGVLLYECLTGVMPFNADNYGSLLVKILNERAKSPRKLRPAISPELDAVVMTALAHDREERFSSATEMLAALNTATAVSAGSTQRIDVDLSELGESGGDPLRATWTGESLAGENTVPGMSISQVLDDSLEDPTEISESFAQIDVSIPKAEKKRG